jgi:AcrR family transcriptional regulator
MALLEATIDCVAQDGYAQATTRRIAARAHVTPGALQHHFASKTELVGETLRYLLARFAEDMLTQEQPGAVAANARNEALLDRMWQLHRGPLFQAGLELLVAARTDPELREHLLDAQREISDWIEVGGPLYPELATRHGFAQLVMTSQAAMSGLAMLGLADEALADAAWSVTRKHLLALSEQLMSSAGGARR